MGLIDTCPDQEYLAQKLLPVYSKIQLGEIPRRRWKQCQKRWRLRRKCPRPDWNYLRWDGYSDEKYRGIINGSALLKLPHYGKKVPLELQVRSYYSGGNLALLLVDWSDDYPEPWGICRSIWDTLWKRTVPLWMSTIWARRSCPGSRKTAWGPPQGGPSKSGFVTYPEYRFHADRLRALDDYGYQEYSERYDREHGRME